jgi:hypothetical protein
MNLNKREENLKKTIKYCVIVYVVVPELSKDIEKGQN